MPYLLALALAISHPAHSSTLGNARAALRRAVAGLEKGEISQEQFERRLPPAQIPTWRRLQQRTPTPQPGSADLAFVLAYYGVDYAHNLQRLLLPYRRWKRVQANLGTPSAHEAAVVQNLPEDLMILFSKHHDRASLGALLDLQLGGAGEDTFTRAAIHFQQLWSRSPATILRVAAGSPTRLGSVAKLLAEWNDTPGDRQQLLARVRKLTRYPDPQVARAARQVIFLLKADHPAAARG